jgi:hypothetical protein
MQGFCICGISLSFTWALAFNSATVAAPDISGTYWASSYSPTIQVLGGGAPPLNAAGKAAYEKVQAGLKDGSIVDKARRVCVPDGVPRVLATPYPFEVFLAPAGQVTFLYEMNHQVRVIVMDKPLPPRQTLIVDAKYNGHSIGRWDGDTLVVDTVGFNGRTRLDTIGHPHSDKMHVIQRFTYTDPDHLTYEVTIDDPKYYSRPWTNTRTFWRLPPGQELIEYSCEENNRDFTEGHIK